MSIAAFDHQNYVKKIDAFPGLQAAVVPLQCPSMRLKYTRIPYLEDFGGNFVIPGIHGIFQPTGEVQQQLMQMNLQLHQQQLQLELLQRQMQQQQIMARAPRSQSGGRWTCITPGIS